MSQLKTILPYFRPYRAPVLIGLLLVVVANAFTIANPFLMKLAIDSVADPDLSANTLGIYAILIVVAAILAGAARFGMRELLNGVSRRIEVDLRNDFFRHLLRLDSTFYGKIRTGDLMSRATNDTLAVRMAAGPAIMYSVNTAVGFVFALALMLWLSPALTLMALIPMVVLPPAVLWFGRIIHRKFEQIQEQFSALSTMVQENLTGVRIVRAYSQEGAQATEFDAINREYMRRNLNLVKAAGLFHPVLGLMSGVAMIAVLWYGGTQVMDGGMTIGDFVAFGFYLTLLAWPMIALGWVVNLFQRGAASMGRLNKILSTEPKVAMPADPLPVASGPATVEFSGVSFAYPGTDRPVLDDVSFIAEPGMTVAIVGPTGAGKSTLVSLIPRTWDPQSGEVRVNGISLDRYDPADLRGTIGMVPQDTFLFSDTLASNIALGGHEEDGEGEEGVVEAAKVAQLHDTITGFPAGYDTLLGERGINLSGGQKQRATLARAIARDPGILILDDALSAVDTQTEARILVDLQDTLRGRTTFIVSHRVTAVMNADLILVLDDGKVVERGTHSELLAMAGTYTALLQRQLLEQEFDSMAPGD